MESTLISYYRIYLHLVARWMWLMLWNAVNFPNKRGERGPCLVLPHRLSLQPDRILSLDGVSPSHTVSSLQIMID